MAVGRADEREPATRYRRPIRRTTRGLMQSQTGSRNPILPLLFLASPLGSAVSAIVDGAMKVRDLQGYWSWSTTSNYSSVFITCFAYLIIGLSLIAIARDLLGEKRLYTMPLLIIAAPIALIICQFLRTDISTALNTLGVIIVLTATTLLGINERDVRFLARLALAVAVMTIIFATVNPERGLVPCRIDKCTILNGLLTSFFPQENVFAVFMIISLVVVMFGLRGMSRTLGALLMITLVALSGSRTVTAAAITIALLSLSIIYLKSGPLRSSVRVASGTLALALFATSAVLFFIPLDPLALTGRGFIYNLLRHFWFEQPIIGPGRGVLEYAFSIGISANYAISHEHGGMPYILVNGGLFLAFFFSYWLMRLVRANTRSDQSWMSGLCLVFTVTVAIISVTEPIWTYDLKSPAFWTLALVSCSLFPSGADSRQMIPADPLEERLR